MCLREVKWQIKNIISPHNRNAYAHKTAQGGHIRQIDPAHKFA